MGYDLEQNAFVLRYPYEQHDFTEVSFILSQKVNPELERIIREMLTDTFSGFESFHKTGITIKEL